MGVGWGTEDGEEDNYDGKYCVARCETCKEILLYHSIFDGKESLLFPDCSGQVFLATVFCAFQYCCSTTLGANPS
ncbi:MAG: hypothetical protein AB2809_16565, partial [Candidatus Thiodiazotropha sp.]